MNETNDLLITYIYVCNNHALHAVSYYNHLSPLAMSPYITHD